MTAPLRVMLVDDDPPVRRSLERLLKRNAMEVVGFESPFAALSRMDELKPDVVVSDFKMPEMDGMTFLRAVHDVLPAARRCLLSGFAEFSSSTGVPVDDISFLPKPWDEQLLLKKLRGADQ